MKKVFRGQLLPLLRKYKREGMFLGNVVLLLAQGMKKWGLFQKKKKVDVKDFQI
eukprot:CAMPEP_0201500152 /NCGR_PEP_ID=MMETSP0151_2-20130828/80054_1 /ASSEMBLY_ACC=CAM_ASM_000257 /TAXON_ID=200890 /ORGANISM="Paramoeba atlantica, Strain 621/1 / CCAP 1560/9" /LENGTH=53 /DNA_ID=CAMNT_0047893131 /DNA_START=353 /DNA_END=514 /DNA_ORIENTATION=+